LIPLDFVYPKVPPNLPEEAVKKKGEDCSEAVVLACLGFIDRQDSGGDP
jgi:hypothetical protein